MKGPGSPHLVSLPISHRLVTGQYQFSPWGKECHGHAGRGWGTGPALGIGLASVTQLMTE